MLSWLRVQKRWETFLLRLAWRSTSPRWLRSTLATTQVILARASPNRDQSSIRSRQSANTPDGRVVRLHRSIRKIIAYALSCTDSSENPNASRGLGARQTSCRHDSDTSALRRIMKYHPQRNPLPPRDFANPMPHRRPRIAPLALDRAKLIRKDEPFAL